jgi:hypothetical protein
MSARKQQLQSDLTEAMRARDEITVSTLRMTLTAITKAEVAGTEAVELDDDAILVLLASESKKRAEAADLYEQGGRAELAAKERAEMAVLARYLPAALSDDELAAIVADEVAAAAGSGATGGKAMGQVIKAVRERVGQQADGSRIAAAVKAALGS